LAAGLAAGLAAELSAELAAHQAGGLLILLLIGLAAHPAAAFAAVLGAALEADQAGCRLPVLLLLAGLAVPPAGCPGGSGGIDPWNLPAMEIGIEAYLSRSELCDDRAKAHRKMISFET
jgi:hypothetical protein